MVQLQILNKILNTKSFTLVEDNLLTEEYFLGFKDEFNFIKNHLDTYGNIPDKETFLSHFPSFEICDVTESDTYLIDTLNEEFLFSRAVPIVERMATLLEQDSNVAVEYLLGELDNLQPQYSIGGVDIIHDAQIRLAEYEDRKANPHKYFIESGFKEIDEITHGWQKGEELAVIFARTNQGKSWILEKSLIHAWQTKHNVGYLSPEMGANSVGFRFDTLFNHFKNSSLVWGKSEGIDGYAEYINELAKNECKFIVSVPKKDFGGHVTVSKLKQWVLKYKLDVIAIDGIKYLSDERYRRGDSVTTSLTNISEDLMALSVELGIPILVVVQANRMGAVGQDEEGTPDIESIRDSDGIAHNASKIIAIQQKKNGVLEIGLKKQRNGHVGDKFNYTWDIDTGTFTFLPSDNNYEPKGREQTQVERESSAEDVF